MEKEVKVGKRHISIGCSDMCHPKIFTHFITLLKKKDIQKAFTTLMNKHDVPNHVIVNFRQGKGDLYAQYFVYDTHVAEHLIIIDIYTKPFEERMAKYKDYDLDHELLDTFAHELIHNTIESERETLKQSAAFMQTLPL